MSYIDELLHTGTEGMKWGYDHGKRVSGKRTAREEKIEIQSKSEIDIPEGYEYVDINDDIVLSLKYKGQRVLENLGFTFSPLKDMAKHPASPLGFGIKKLKEARKETKEQHKNNLNEINSNYKSERESLKTKTTNSNDKKHYN